LPRLVSKSFKKSIIGGANFAGVPAA